MDSKAKQRPPNFSGASFAFTHSVGFRQTECKSIEYAGEDEIIYLVGKHAAIYSQESKSVKFILTESRVSEVVTFAVSPNQKYVALSEVLSDSPHPQISVFSVASQRRVRLLSFEGMAAGSRVRCLDFSRDSKFLVACTSEPDLQMTWWHLDKPRCALSVPLPSPVTKVSIAPSSSPTPLIATSGRDNLRIWKFVEGTLKSISLASTGGGITSGGPGSSGNVGGLVSSNSSLLGPMAAAAAASSGFLGGSMKKDYNFSGHSWYDEDKFLASTMEGDVLVVENMEVRRILPSIFPDSASIYSVVAIGRGFVAGGGNGTDGNLAVYERTYDSEFFKLYRRFSAPERHDTIRDLSIAPREDEIICCHASNQFSKFSLANVDILSDDKGVNNFPRLPVDFHSQISASSSSASGALVASSSGSSSSGASISVDLCVQRPIIVSAGVGGDNLIRVYNFERKVYEITKHLQDEILSVALHPTGLMLLVAFRYKLQVFDLITNDLYPCHDIQIKNCKEVRYSNGGSLFVAVCGTLILVFNAYTFELVGNLRGHSGMIKSVCWSKSDRLLVSAGYDGAVYEWSIEELKRVEENVVKGCNYQAVVYDDATGAIAAAGTAGSSSDSSSAASGGRIRQIQGGNVVAEVSLPAGLSATRLCLSHDCKTLLVGTSNGSVLAYRWPLPPPSVIAAATGPLFYDDVQLHSRGISQMRLSFDEKNIFSVGEDFSLFILELENWESGNKIPHRELTYSVYEGLAFLTKQENDDREVKLVELRQEIKDLRMDKEMQLKLQEQQHTEEMKAMREEWESKLASLQQQLALVRSEKSVFERDATHRIEKIQTEHMKAAEDVETLYERKIMDLEQRLLDSEAEKKDKVLRYQDTIADLREQHEATMEQLRAEYEVMLQEQREAYDGLEGDVEHMRAEYEEMLAQTAVEYEGELTDNKDKAMAELGREHESLENARGQVAVFKRDQVALEHDKRKLLSKMDEMDKEIRSFQTKHSEQNKLIEDLRGEIRLRDDTIGARERRISELKKQTSELEKLRYVLTYKFNELKKEVGPQEERIRELSQRIKEMDTEMERIGTDRDALKHSIDGYKDKIDVLTKEVAKNKRFIDDKERLIGLLLRELSDLVGKNDSKHALVNLKEIVSRYNAKYQKEEDLEVVDHVQEFERQREYMEQQLNSVKKQSSRKAEHLLQDNQRKTLENSALVSEINTLRQEKRQLQQKVSSLELQLRELVMSHTSQRLPASSSIGGGSANSSRPPTAAAMRATTPNSYFAHRPGSQVAARPNSSLSGVSGGRLVRGSTAHQRDSANPLAIDRSSSRVADMVSQVEKNNSEMHRQQEEIHKLRDYVQSLLISSTSGDQMMDDVSPNRSVELPSLGDLSAIQGGQGYSSSSPGGHVEPSPKLPVVGNSRPITPRSARSVVLPTPSVLADA